MEAYTGEADKVGYGDWGDALGRTDVLLCGSQHILNVYSNIDGTCILVGLHPPIMYIM